MPTATYIPTQQNLALWHRLAGVGHPPVGWNEDHNSHLTTRALHLIAEALSEGSDHDAHVFRRLAYQASLPRQECVIPGLVITTAELRQMRSARALYFHFYDAGAYDGETEHRIMCCFWSVQDGEPNIGQSQLVLASEWPKFRAFIEGHGRTERVLRYPFSAAA